MEKLTIEEMHRIAKGHNGKCLSKRYNNARTNLKWRCAEGHIWKATPDSIKNQGSWCQKCSNRRIVMLQRLNIEMMQEIAKQKNGKCLSGTYVNNKTPLLWECSEGHQWEAIPNNVKRGSWCPYCARMARKGEKSNKN